MKSTESVVDGQNLISDVSELQNRDLGGDTEILVYEISDKTNTQIPPRTSIVHTMIRYARKSQPPNSYTPKTNISLSYEYSR